MERETVDAWSRPAMSDEHPSGTSKRNPFDTVIRLIGMAHKYDAGLAREIAFLFTAYVDSLDGQSGAAMAGNICDGIARLVKEHADIIVLFTRDPSCDRERLFTEAQELLSELHKFIACLKEEMKAENTLSFKAIAHDAVEKSRAANGGRK